MDTCHSSLLISTTPCNGWMFWRLLQEVCFLRTSVLDAFAAYETRIMSARPVIKTSTMAADMQEAAIQVAQDAIRDNNLEKEIANAVKAAFEGLYPSL